MATKPITIIAPTPGGYRLAQVLQTGLGDAEIWTKVTGPGNSDLPLSTVVAELWKHRSQLIFILAVGAVVRLIAPLLQQKAIDPGIVAVDETGRFVISLSGGHQGGADALACQVAALLGVEPIITSASEGQGLPAIDLLGKPYGWQSGQGDWLKVAAALTQRETIGVIQTCGWDLWRTALPAGHPFVFRATLDDSQGQAQVWISDRLPPATQLPLVCWHPRTLWIGVGCERETTASLMAESLLQVLTKHGLAIEAIAGLATIDLKQDEVGLQALARKFNWPLHFLSADELATQTVPNPSAIVARAVGTPSVAEAAAVQVANAPLIVTKQVFREERGACTLAIARTECEYNPRPGQIYLIGAGPGALEQITLAVRAALTQCDVVIGYQRYLDLIRPLLPPNQIAEASMITQEVQRAERAIALAKRGLTVGVISSGDCGIYGMAGLVLECLARQDWDCKTPAVEVLPGISALQAVAARVGAPLMHDFCAISLSDLLTPWPVIEKRLEAAAQADFVVALYNPRSQTRTEGIRVALEIFLKWRSPDTPVAIARSVYRSEETVHLTTLAEVDIEPIDMLTVVLIGNQSTFLHRKYMITPRGYGKCLA